MAKKIARVFLDANILFTAAYNPQGLAFHFIDQAHLQAIKLIMSDYALEEARLNIVKKAPEQSPFFEKLLKRIEVVDVVCDMDVNSLKLPSDDVPILQGALKSECSFLISGDKKAFGKWINKKDQTFGITIISLREFVDKYLC